MTIKEAIEKATVVLKTNKIETPKQKARMLMQYILKQSRQYIIVYDSKELSRENQEQYFKIIEEVKNGTPVQHITNKQEFMKLEFYVDENVLIPRPDTEILVEEVLEKAKKIEAKNILELCTGSGAIAIALAKYMPELNITAIDISKEALKVAKKNAKTNEVEKNIQFINSDLYENVPKKKYDIIVSNPPYVKRPIIPTLKKEVQKEPKIALDGGYDGLDFYKRIIPEAKNYLNSNGYICLEIGYDQKEEVLELIKKEKLYKKSYAKKDLFDKERIVCAKLN